MSLRSLEDPPSTSVTVRNSRDGDVPAMLSIYMRHIAAGVDPDALHDSEAPDAEDIKRRRKSMHRRDEFDGSGIGLATCKEIADRLGWGLSATSRVGEGAKFAIDFPVETGRPN